MLRQLRRFIPEQEIDSHLLVDEGEVVIDVVRHHFVVYFMPLVWALLGLVSLLVVFVGPIQLGWFFLLVWAALWLWAGFHALQDHMDIFAITNMRVFRARGLFNVKIATMPIARILDITVDKPFLGRLLGYGHFVFESAAQEQGLRDIRYIGDPDDRDLTIQRVIQRSGLRGPRNPTY